MIQLRTRGHVSSSKLTIDAKRRNERAFRGKSGRGLNETREVSRDGTEIWRSLSHSAETPRFLRNTNRETRVAKLRGDRNTRPRCIFFSRYTCVACIAAAVDSIVSTWTAEARQDSVEKGISPGCSSTIAFFFHRGPFDAADSCDRSRRCIATRCFLPRVSRLSCIYRIRPALLEDQRKNYAARPEPTVNSSFSPTSCLPPRRITRRSSLSPLLTV